MTGTPLAQGMSNLIAALRFLQFESSQIDITLIESTTRTTWEVHDIIRKNFFWRNTKASIGDEYSVPDVVEELMMLDMVFDLVL